MPPAPRGVGLFLEAALLMHQLSYFSGAGTSLEQLAHSTLYCNYLCKKRTSVSHPSVLLSLIGHLEYCGEAEMFRKLSNYSSKDFIGKTTPRLKNTIFIQQGG